MITMPPRDTARKADPGPPPFWIAVTDIPAPYSEDAGVMPEVMLRAGDRVPAHMVPDPVDPALVKDPRGPQPSEPGPPGPSEEK